MKKIIWVSLLAWTLGACNSWTSPGLADSKALDSIIEKKTTAEEVRSLLGEPAYIFAYKSGDAMWGYRRYHGSPFSATKFTSVILDFHDGVVLSKDVNRL